MRARWFAVPAVSLALVVGGGCLGGGGGGTDAAGSRPAGDDQDSGPMPELSAAPPQRGPLYGVLPAGVGSSELARLDPRTLLPAKGVPRISLEGQQGVHAVSPDRSIAVAGDDGAVTIFDLEEMRALGTVTAKREMGASLSARWLSPRQVLLVGKPDQHELVATVVDAADRRVVAQRGYRTPLDAVSARPAPGGVVVLFQPSDRIGTAELGYVDVRGRLDRAPLRRVRAGQQQLERPDGGQVPAFRQVQPGLAVDPDGGHAFVVSAGSPVAEVTLPGLRTTYHTVGKPGRTRSVLSWLRRALAPPAEAKIMNGPRREAAWLGDGRLAVWGADTSYREGEDSTVTGRTRAYGLRVIDTGTWTIRPLVPAASDAVLARDRLVAFGGSATEGAETPARTGGAGLQILTPGADDPTRLFGGRMLSWVEAYGRYAYARLDRPDTSAYEQGFAVVDLRTGKIVGRHHDREIPWLLP